MNGWTDRSDTVKDACSRMTNFRDPDGRRTMTIAADPGRDRDCSIVSEVKKDMDKKSMSVMEMGRLIGLKKTTAYWLVNKGLFEVRIVSGKQRVMVDSFNEWLEGQSHYRVIGNTGPCGKDEGETNGINS